MSNSPKPPIQFPSEESNSRRHLIICAIIVGVSVVVAIVGMIGISVLMFFVAAVREEVAQQQKEAVVQEQEEEVAEPAKTKEVMVSVRKDLSSEAWVMAQLFLEDHLKSPSTASYGWQTSDDCVTNLGDGVYQVKGWVDSQNSFGATVRTEFVVKVKDKGDGNTWSLVGKPIMVQR